MSFLTVCLNPTLQKTLRFSSVLSGEVNRTADHRLDVSGKGINVTRVLTQLGKKAVHLTQLGGELRPLFLSLCEKDNLSIEWVESNSPIRFCYTVLADGVTELVEESEVVGADTEKLLLAKFDAIISRPSLILPSTPYPLPFLIISGTKATGFSDSLIPSMVRMAKEKGLRIILDIKGKDLLESLQYAPDIIKPNLSEFASSFGIDEKAKEQIKAVMQDLCSKYKTSVILTDGSRRLLAVDKEESGCFEEDITPVKAVNTTGCGDAFTAGLASSLEDGKSFRDAIAEGIRCGALNAGLVKPGVIF